MRRWLPSLVLLALIALPLAAQAPAAVAPAVGQEWIYRGTVAMRIPGGEGGQTRGLEMGIHVATTLVGRSGSEWQVVRHEWGETESPPLAPFRRLWIANRVGHYAGGGDNAPPPMLAPTLVGLPVAFSAIPKPGEEVRERFRIFGEPDAPELNAVRRVNGKERIGPRECLVIERQPTDTLPLKFPENLALKSYSERLWVDAATGVLVRYEGALAIESAEAGGGQFEFEIRLALAGVKRLSPAETRARLQQASTLQATARQIARLADARDPAAETARVRTRLRDLQRRYPNSPYREVARDQLRQLQREAPPRPAAPASPLVGNPAPELRLKDLEGKERTLAEFRGKIVILNFFASW